MFECFDLLQDTSAALGGGLGICALKGIVDNFMLQSQLGFAKPNRIGAISSANNVV